MGQEKGKSIRSLFLKLIFNMQAVLSVIKLLLLWLLSPQSTSVLKGNYSRSLINYRRTEHFFSSARAKRSRQPSLLLRFVPFLSTTSVLLSPSLLFMFLRFVSVLNWFSPCSLLFFAFIGFHCSFPVLRPFLLPWQLFSPPLLRRC